MNSLERTLIEKSGYDNGWEIVVKSSADCIELASALHKSITKITPSTKFRWQLQFPIGLLTTELSRELGLDNTERFHVSHEQELATVLKCAAKLSRSLPNIPELRFEKAIRDESEEYDLEKTEVERLVRQRIGQNIFRESLMDYWGGSCAVTGIKIPELLRASHIKAWAECETNSERLNVFNGLLLCSHLDALFDRHLISFDTKGKIIFSSNINASDLEKIGVTPDSKLRWISAEHETFLRHHRAITD